MCAFAEGTVVPIEKTRAEIEKLLARYKATGFAYGTKGPRTMMEFEMSDRRVRFTLTLPEPGDPRFRKTPSGRYMRSAQGSAEAYNAECRRLWRALHLSILAKLEAVASGITTFEKEFLAYVVLPTGRTVADHAIPALQNAYTSQSMRPLLPGSDSIEPIDSDASPPRS